MASYNFKKLSETSQLLVASSSPTPLPSLKRDMSQILKETETMSKRIKTNPQLLAQAHYFLAQGGINSQELAQNLNAISTVSTVPRPEIINNTDVEGYLQQRHELDIIDTIEELRQLTDNYVDDIQDKLFEDELKHLEARMKETTAQSSQPKETDLYTHYMNVSTNVKLESQIGEQMEAFARVVIETNKKRLTNTDHCIIKAFNDAMVNDNNVNQLITTMEIDSMDGTTKSKDHRVTDVWQLLDKLTGESEAGVNERIQGRYMNTYLNAPPDSTLALDTRRQLIKKSKQWLEHQMIEYMDDVLLKHAHEIKPGGNPSFVHRLQSYLKLTFKKHGQWADRLQIVEDLPIWTFIYMAFRSGQENLALEFIDQNPSKFAAESNFVGYLREYLSSPDRCLSQETQGRVMMDYQLMEYSSRTVDPYKLVLTKILGRCRLSKKTYPDVITASEDYLWFQLTLIRENLDEHNYWEEKYTLYDLQQLMVKFGAKQYDPTGTAPWTYFKVLLVTLQFEQAINYLYKNEHTRLQSIHFAIALMYYGLLRIPKEPMQIGADLLIMENNNTTATLNITRMIYQYLHHNTSINGDLDAKHANQQAFYTTNQSTSTKKKQPYIKQHPLNSIHYLFLMTLYSTRNGYFNDNMVTMARSYVRDLILNNNDYKSFLGPSLTEAKTKPGHIDLYKGLLGMENEQDYIRLLLEPLALKYTDRGKYPEAVYVYELSGNYNRIVDILNQRLSQALRQPTRSIERTEKMTIPEIIEFIQSTLARYEHNQHILHLMDDTKRRTVRVLIQFVKGKQLYDQQQYDKALQIIGQTGVIPIEDGCSVIQTVDQFNKLDNIICNSTPDVLLLVMDALYKLWKPYITVDDSRRAAIHQPVKIIEQKSRSLLAFVGLINLKIPSDTIIKLNKVDIAIMEGKI